MMLDNAREKNVEEGLELIIRHLDDSTPVWPRWISTYINTGLVKKQRFWLAHNKQEVLALYKAANFIDCRIKPYSSDNVAPSLLLVDIDRENFDTTEEFEQCAAILSIIDRDGRRSLRPSFASPETCSRT